MSTSIITGPTSLLSARCLCGRAKHERKSFCRFCYNQLPPSMREALWQRVGEGYEQAFFAARGRLRQAGAIPASKATPPNAQPRHEARTVIIHTPVKRCAQCDRAIESGGCPRCDIPFVDPGAR